MTLAEFARMFDCSVPEILERLRNNKNDFWRWWWTQFASEPMGVHHASLDRSMCQFGKIMKRIDVAPLLQEIDAKPENWLLDTKRNKIGVQQHTNSIALRRAVYKPVPGADNVNIMMDVQESAAGAIAAHYPALMHFLGQFAEDHGKGSLSRAMIVRLTPKTEVGRHWDTGYYYLCRDRYHLILQSAGSRMECGGVRCTWNVGEVWWFNNNLWHSAGNDGDEWRIHVIFDVLPHRNAALVDEFKRHTEYYRSQVLERV
jgi:hypothetical protein